MPPAPSAIEQLSGIIAGGLSSDHEAIAVDARNALNGLFGEQFRAATPKALRVAFMSGERNVPFAGLLHSESPDSGVYGGMSLVWFPVPTDDAGPAESLLTLVCGTRGLSPDESIISRPGHRRQLQALARSLSRETSEAVWVKRDPSHLGLAVPEVIASQYPRFRGVFERYGGYIYALCRVPHDAKLARQVVSRFLHLYGLERGWVVLNAAASERDALLDSIESNVFTRISAGEVARLLRERRFVILQGPPGTGKSRLAAQLVDSSFGGQGRVVQFHPAVTYETFVAGIAPDVRDASLRFRTKPGWLIEANRRAASGDFLFVIDEINRADLGRVLGEAVYLFEAGEIGADLSRSVGENIAFQPLRRCSHDSSKSSLTMPMKHRSFSFPATPTFWRIMKLSFGIGCGSSCFRYSAST